MEITIVALFMDAVILAFLGGTIFYAMRLMKALDNFRSNRGEMQKLIKELSEHIDHAQIAINGMNEASKNSGEELQGVINDARRLSDELRQVNAAGEGMAQRLENLATDNRKAAQASTPGYSGGGIAAAVAREEALSAPANPSSSMEKPYSEPPKDDEAPAFFIQDREYNSDADAAGGTQSLAEKELLEALRKRGAGGS